MHNAFQALQMAEFGIVNYQIRLKAKLISIFFSGFGFTRDMLSGLSLYGLRLVIQPTISISFGWNLLLNMDESKLWNKTIKKLLWKYNHSLENTQRWFNAEICWSNVATLVNVISTLIQRRFVNVDSSIKFNVETTLILGWL